MEACTTRLRLDVADQAAVDEAALRALGARGFVRPSADSLQVVLGPIADQVAGEMRAALREGPASSPFTDSKAAGQLSRLIDALGGAGNIARVEDASTRLLVTLRDAALANEQALAALAVRGIARPSPASVHVLVGPGAADLAQQLRRRLA